MASDLLTVLLCVTPSVQHESKTKSHEDAVADSCQWILTLILLRHTCFYILIVSSYCKVEPLELPSEWQTSVLQSAAFVVM